MAITKPVIIAGAGPVGCVAALRLVQAGIPIILLEGAAELPRTLRASTFHPPTVDMMDELGITAELEAQGLICRYYQYRDRRTGEIAEFDLDVLREDTKHPYRLQVEQYKLTQLIWKILERDYPHLSKCLLNHMVKGVYQSADGAEVLAWEGMQERLFEGSFVLACDGSDSAIRKAMAIQFEGFTYPERFLVASTEFPLETKFDRLANVNYVSDPDEWLVLLRTPSVWRVLIPTDPKIEDDNYFLSDRWIQDRLHHMAPHDADYPLAHRSIYRVHQRVAKIWRRGRVLLAGDSAHMNNPLGGMGANGGIHDSWNAAEKLIRIHHGEPMDPLLDLYDRQRRTICVKFVQEHTINNKKLMESKDPDVQRKRQAEFMRNCSDPTLSRAFLLKTSMIQSLRDAAAIT